MHNELNASNLCLLVLNASFHDFVKVGVFTFQISFVLKLFVLISHYVLLIDKFDFRKHFFRRSNVNQS